MKILILGATGMLGNAMMRVLHASAGLSVIGTARGDEARHHFAAPLRTGVNALDPTALQKLFTAEKPDVVINCIGVVKQLAQANDPLVSIPLNSLLPWQLSALCAQHGARLIQISTDCVFSGRKGNYTESDTPDATDLYGRSKLLGEVDAAHAITLRTSIIGHELSGQRSLVNWFLNQQQTVKGFTRAIFSGLPTVELANVVRDHVLANPQLHGVYHVAAAPIAKYDLLKLIGAVYGHDVEIVPDDALVIDRSLNAVRFNRATGYNPPAWPALIERMHASEKERTL